MFELINVTASQIYDKNYNFKLDIKNIKAGVVFYSYIRNVKLLNNSNTGYIIYNIFNNRYIIQENYKQPTIAEVIFKYEINENKTLNLTLNPRNFQNNNKQEKNTISTNSNINQENKNIIDKTIEKINEENNKNKRKK